MMDKIINIPFSSSKFVFNEENFGVAYREIEEFMIARLKNINQLQRLTPSQSDKGGYLWFPFPQSRFDHSVLFLAVARIILSKAEFLQDFVQKFLLTLLTHDIATPAGGDATMRLNKWFFCEVKNYARHMIESGISHKWQLLYGFDADESANWVDGMDFAGSLLNVLDRLSYTALDVYHLGKGKPAKILRLLKKYPLVIDVWQDICVLKNSMYFSNAYRLYHFLLLRALMHTEFYLNPDCRKLEHLFFSETKKLFQSGEISVEDLRYNDDRWLDMVVRKRNNSAWCTNTGEVSWQRFECEQEADVFYEENGRAFHKEHIKQFELGIHWLVMHGGKIMPLSQALPRNFINEIESLAKAREGWYVYYFK